MKKKAMALLLAAGLIGSAAAAEVSFNGTVEARHTGYVYSPVAGTVDEVLVKAGETVTADTVIATLKTTKVYAAEDGVITAVFGQPGDSAETVAEKYGAVMYLEGENTYSISASTSKAYDELENFVVHPGETVYVVARNRTKYKGQGVITAVDGNSYTVMVTEGEFFVGDSMDIMRSADYETTSRIGRGNIARVSPTAVTGTGSIVSFAVQPGEKVQRGQLLFETIDGTYAGLEMTGTEIKAGQDGVIAELNIENGTAVTADSAVASIYPKGDVWVNAAVTEADLNEIAVGQKVKVELDWNEDRGVSYEQDSNAKENVNDSNLSKESSKKSTKDDVESIEKRVVSSKNETNFIPLFPNQSIANPEIKNSFIGKKIKDSGNYQEKLKENKNYSFCNDDNKKDEKKEIKNQKNNSSQESLSSTRGNGIYESNQDEILGSLNFESNLKDDFFEEEKINLEELKTKKEKLNYSDYQIVREKEPKFTFYQNDAEGSNFLWLNYNDFNFNN